MIKIVIFLLAFIFTFILRAHNYERSPFMGNLEEMLYGWSGIYLVETGVPVSWSTLDYPKKAEVFRGTIDYKGGLPKGGVSLYKPWLDEPPLFSLLVGWFGHFYKADRTDWIPTAFIRFPVIFISTLTSIFIFLVAKKLTYFWVGILSMLIYGTVPIFVLSSRMAVPENLIALSLIIIIFLLIKFKDQRKKIYLLPIPVLCGVAGLAKPTGFFIMPLVLFILFEQRMIRNAIYIFFSTIPFILIFFAYGIYFDAEIFWKITSVQSFRPVGFKSLAWFFTSPSYDWTTLTDSWYVFTLLCAVYFIFSPPSKKLIIIPFSFVYWLIIIMISGGEGDLLAWYRYPLFPFLSIMGSWGLIYLIKKANFFTSFIAVGMLLGGRSLLVNAFNPNIQPLGFRLTLGFLLFPSIINEILKASFLKNLIRLILIFVIITGFYFNIKYIYSHYEISCQGAECILGPQTFLSKLHLPFIWRLFVI